MSDKYYYVLRFDNYCVEVSEETLNVILKDLRSQGIIEYKRLNDFNPFMSDIFITNPNGGETVIARQVWY